MEQMDSNTSEFCKIFLEILKPTFCWKWINFEIAAPRLRLWPLHDDRVPSSSGPGPDRTDSVPPVDKLSGKSASPPETPEWCECQKIIAEKVPCSSPPSFLLLFSCYFPKKIGDYSEPKTKENLQIWIRPSFWIENKWTNTFTKHVSKENK